MKISELEKKIDLQSLIAEKYHVAKTGKNYVVNPCPVCDHKDHFFIYPNTNSYSSFSDCCKGGGVYKYLTEVEKMDDDAAYKKLHELSGVTMGDNDFTINIENAPTGTVEAQKQPINQTDLTNHITKLHQNAIKNFPEEFKGAFLNRGITASEITKYKLSIFRDKDGLRAVLPIWSKGKVVYYTTRALEGQSVKYRNVKGVANHFFNMDLLDEPQDKPIIIVEGVMDALSLEYAGHSAIALNSVENASKLIETIRNKPNAQNTIFLTAFDNDAAGQKAAESLPYKKIIIPEQYADINEWHIDSLVNSQEAAEGFVSMEDNISTQLESATKPDAISDYLDHGFLSDIEKLTPFRNKRTGFDNLDIEMKGLYAGLYVIGGISSVGKTTFVHQLGDQLAEIGDHVIYFSLEQSKLEMVSKSIARTTAKKDLNRGVSSIFIRNGDRSADVIDAIEDYRKIAGRVNVVEGNFNTNVRTIREYVELYIKQNKVNPIVIVDYLQIMPSFDERMNDKQKVDMNVTELKRMSRDHSLSVFVISSLNRGNYLAPIDFESFKESGGIEYTADVVWGLQLEAINDEIFDKANNIKAKREKIGEAKAEDPRQIELVCLKNRNGKPSFTCSFSYHSKFDYYEPNIKNAKGFSLDFSQVVEPKNSTKKAGSKEELEMIQMDGIGGGVVEVRRKKRSDGRI